MVKWTKKQLEELDNIVFAIAILNERKQSTTNSYSFLNQKLNEAIAELEEIKRKNINSVIKNAVYTSVWDGGIKITADCKVNMKTKEVFDIKMDDNDNIESLDVLDSEYITVDGADYDVVNASENGVAKSDYWYV